MMNDNNQDFQKRLKLHLLRAEIEFIAIQDVNDYDCSKTIPAVERGEIQPSEVEVYLKQLGYKVKERYEYGEKKWLVCSGKLRVCIDTGYIDKE